MFYNQPNFYFATCRKITAAFGAIFTNVQVQRYSELANQGTVLQTIRVPFSYSASEKWLDFLHEKVEAPASQINDGPKTKIRKSLPRMGYELVNIAYDNSRKQITTAPNAAINPSNSNTLLKQLNPVPFNYYFDVYVSVKNIEDGLQILEQILPNFTPSFNVTIKDIPELGITRDIPVIFNGINPQDTYEGQYDESRIITWTLSFTVKGYMYPAITSGSIIKDAMVNLYADTQIGETPKEEMYEATVDPLSASETDSHTIIEHIYSRDELDSSGNPL